MKEKGDYYDRISSFWYGCAVKRCNAENPNYF